MKWILVLLPVLTLLLGKIYADAIKVTDSRVEFGIPYLKNSDTLTFDQEKAIADLREQIKGREKEPAALVFENIKTFERMPAGRLLNIMEMGFSGSLGVTCTHCHNPNDWASEEKPQKQIARDMMAMVGKINGELLTAIDNLESDRPAVNCTTCHRGQVKPALNLENK